MRDAVIRVRYLAATWLLVAACGGGVGGAGGENDECRSTADCDGELECAGVNDGPACGIPPMEQCSSDLDCNGGTVCHATFDACSADQVGSRCAEPCVEDADCGATFECDAGNCIATPCDAGFACAGREECAVDQVMSTAPVFAQHHGCFAVTCSTDADCGERFCVNSTCQDAAGACIVAVAVP